MIMHLKMILHPMVNLHPIQINLHPMTVLHPVGMNLHPMITIYRNSEDLPNGDK